LPFTGRGLTRKRGGQARTVPLGSHVDSAEDTKAGADPVGPLTHALQSPGPAPASLEIAGVYAAAVIAHHEPQLFGLDLEIHFDLLRPGMAVGICDSLARNSANLVIQPAPQASLFALYHHAKRRRAPDSTRTPDCRNHNIVFHA
jgi:hypothetical protein